MRPHYRAKTLEPQRGSSVDAMTAAVQSSPRRRDGSLGGRRQDRETRRYIELRCESWHPRELRTGPCSGRITLRDLAVPVPRTLIHLRMMAPESRLSEVEGGPMLSKDYQRIKQARSDISEFVLHCTKEHGHPAGGKKITLSPPDALKHILQDGFLEATYAWYQGSGASRPTIRGPQPAVCFTDQPVRFFLQSITASKGMLRDRYTEFGVAVMKADLYRYGGRPVIYSSEGILGVRLTPDELRRRQLRLDLLVYKDGLPEAHQYLWAHYDPTRWDSQSGARPVDFTHEREWRARPRADINGQIGLTERADMVVPLLLRAPQSMDPTQLVFVILVDTEDRRGELTEWIEEQAPRISARGAYWCAYGHALLSTAREGRILSFERIESESSVPRLCRIEDFLTTRD